MIHSMTDLMSFCQYPVQANCVLVEDIAVNLDNKLNWSTSRDSGPQVPQMHVKFLEKK